MKDLRILAKKHQGILMILLFALMIRVAYFIVVDPPTSWHDASIHDGIAQSLLSGEGYSLEGDPSAAREPGYAMFFLVPTYFIFGHSILAVQIIQTILSLVMIGGVYRIGEKLMSPLAGLIGAFLLAINLSSIIYVGEILTENFYTFTLFVGVITFLIAVQKKSQWIFFVSGLIFGLATLTRFNTALIFMILFFVLWIIQKSFKKAFTRSLLVGLGIVLMVTPWIVRNYIQFDQFVPGRMGSGKIIWSGSYVPWGGERLGEIYELEVFIGVDKLPIDEQDDIFMKQALQNIKDDPLGVAWIWARKPFKILLVDEMALYFNEENALISNYDITFLKENPGVITFIRISFEAFHLLLIMLACYGWRLLYRRDQAVALTFAAVIIYALSSYIPMNGVPRYLVPLWPYLMVFDGLAAHHLLQKFPFKSINEKN